MLRRLPLIYLAAAAALLTLAALVLRGTFDSRDAHNALWAPGSVGHPTRARGDPAQDDAVEARARELLARERTGTRDQLGVASLLQHGEVIMPKLPNATAKAELGRASWKLLHTMAARFPEHPTEDQRDTFKSFLFLFSRLYPCGECAAEFQQLLRKHPPQTSSRASASLYLCHLHNLVNARLGKDEYDCGTNLRDVYDCGCGDEEEKERNAKGNGEVVGAKTEREARRRETTEDINDAETRRDPETGFELLGG
ncbi:flavin-linked sulfhydryl oxidase [Rhodotorula paludigena]|uniref:flavin-linked sulfhydryl oxidase n=1 Tax=Rhodotorula paludigena TaxID=86838 RepID=UPI0031719D1E